MIYSDSKGQWLIDANGQPNYLAEANALLSPDQQWARSKIEGDDDYILLNITTGYTREVSVDLPWFGSEVTWSSDSRYFYYRVNDENDVSDIWVEEAVTGKRRNLTRTSDRYEGEIEEVHPDRVFFYSWPASVQADGPGWLGVPTVAELNRIGYETAGEEFVTSPGTLSPDGRTIAYAIYDEEENYPIAWFYRVSAAPQRFPWKNFGLQQFATMGFSSPSWSPDGQKIAWWMWSSDGNYKPLFNGIGLFDLEKGQVALLDRFAQFAPDGWPSPVEWSPDGKRVLFYAQHSPSQERENDGIWIANADGRNLRHLINVTEAWYSCHWAWRPDGQWLAISCDDPKIASGIWLAELETGKLLKTNLPDDAEIRGWVNPQP